MNDDLKPAVRKMLDEHHTLTLATSRDGQPWAASVFFASDADLNLFFVSDHQTRHAQDMLANNRVMATVNVDCKRWHDVRGLQIRGRGFRVPEEERAAALRVYLARFADIRAIFDAASRYDKWADEWMIARRLRETAFFRIVPDWVRIIDNSRGFGFSQEFEL